MIFRDGYQVGVFYLRAGYTPDDYPSEKEWNARMMMEKSSAVVCPNIRYHLAGIINHSFNYHHNFYFDRINY